MHSSYFCELKFDCLIQIRSGFHFEIVTCLFEEEFSNFTSVSVHYKLYNFLMNSITTAVTKTSILLSRTTKQITPKSHTCARKKNVYPKSVELTMGPIPHPFQPNHYPESKKKPPHQILSHTIVTGKINSPWGPVSFPEQNAPGQMGQMDNKSVQHRWSWDGQQQQQRKKNGPG